MTALLTTLSLDEARRITDAGIARAQTMGVAMNIAVVDAGGHLLHFVRMDGAWLGSADVAIKKATTAVLFRMPTDALGEMTQPGGSLYGIEVSNGGLISFGGGLPILDPDGRTIGAVGVSGGAVEQDIAVAEASLGGQ
jgi:uncharacterized protein GlcG (DUF336 family)